jgi:hypothetical protein
MSTELQWKDPNAILREIRRTLQAQGQRIANVPAMAVRNATFELQALVQQLAPKRTSTLARSITAKVELAADGTVTGRVGTHLQYAPWVEEGTGIYGPQKREIVVTARNRKGLFWGAYDQDGRPIIRRQVRIKGMKPRAMVGRATAQFLPRYLEIIQRELAKEAQA